MCKLNRTVQTRIVHGPTIYNYTCRLVLSPSIVVEELSLFLPKSCPSSVLEFHSVETFQEPQPIDCTVSILFVVLSSVFIVPIVLKQ